MEITWLGHSCFKIKGNQATVIIDPYSNRWRALPSKLSADIVTVSHEHSGHNYIDDITIDSHLLHGPGEYEIKDVILVGIPSFHDSVKGSERGKNTIYLMEMDELTICHLGDLGHRLNAEELEEVGSVDILMVPVGGVSTLDAGAAAEVVRQLEPRIIIPMHYRYQELDSWLEPVDRFLLEMGEKEVVPQPKYVIRKSRLPLDAQVILLDCQ